MRANNTSSTTDAGWKATHCTSTMGHHHLCVYYLLLMLLLLLLFAQPTESSFVSPAASHNPRSKLLVHSSPSSMTKMMTRTRTRTLSVLQVRKNENGVPPYDGEIYSNVFDVYPFDDDDDDDDDLMEEKKNNNNNNNRSKGTTTIQPATPSLQQQQQQQQQQKQKQRRDDDDSRFSMDDVEQATWVDESLKYFPMVLPFIAYLAYDPTAVLFAAGLDALAQNNNWAAVDGGAYQAKIIAPAINGVVVPAISILFANLIGTTIQTLRQRQLDIRTCLNMEAGQLRILQSLLDVFPTTSTSTSSSTTTSSSSTTTTTTTTTTSNSAMVCRRYLTQYTTRLIAESQPTMAVESLDYSLDTELNGVLAELNRLSSASVMATTMSTTSTTSTSSPAAAAVVVVCSPVILGNAYNACSKLYEERAKRITALRSLFPPLHFIIVSALAVSICIAFLLESKQDILVFLNAIQLRILWTMLVGTFTALALVCYDLGNPFRGSYQISKSVQQLYTIRMTFRASLQQEQQQQQQQRLKKQQEQQQQQQEQEQAQEQEVAQKQAQEVVNRNQTTMSEASLKTQD